MGNFNYAIFIIAAIGAVVIGGIIFARKVLHMEEPVEQKTPEEMAKNDLDSLLTIEEKPEGKKIEDEVGND